MQAQEQVMRAHKRACRELNGDTDTHTQTGAEEEGASAVPRRKAWSFWKPGFGYGQLAEKKSWLHLSLKKGELLEPELGIDRTGVRCLVGLGGPENSWCIILLLINHVSVNWCCTAVTLGG